MRSSVNGLQYLFSWWICRGRMLGHAGNGVYTVGLSTCDSCSVTGGGNCWRGLHVGQHSWGVITWPTLIHAPPSESWSFSFFFFLLKSVMYLTPTVGRQHFRKIFISKQERYYLCSSSFSSIILSSYILWNISKWFKLPYLPRLPLEVEGESDWGRLTNFPSSTESVLPLSVRLFYCLLKLGCVCVMRTWDATNFIFSKYWLEAVLLCILAGVWSTAPRLLPYAGFGGSSPPQPTARADAWAI